MWKSKMWPDGRVPYTLNANLNEEQRTEVAKAIQDYHEKTCIRFVPKELSDVDYVDILRDDMECGRANICREGGQQTAKFGGSCKGADTMIHELGHTLCLNHEFGRPDRLKYVELTGTCNVHGVLHAHHNWLTDDFLYDYLSILHYEVMCTTCATPKLPGVTQCGSKVLSVLDVEKINALYDCPGCKSYRFRPISKLFQTTSQSEDVSINDYIQWHTSFFGQGSGKENENLVYAGHDFQGEKLYICRAYHNGDIVVGSGNILTRSCQIIYQNETSGYEKTENFELLTNPKNAGLKWVEKPKDGVLPPNAIPGGRSAGRETFYIGRCTVTDLRGKVATIPGTIFNAPALISMYVANNGIQHLCSEYDILVCD